MHRIRRLIALGLALAALTLALAGCSGSVDVGSDGSPSSDGGTTTSTKTYTNDQYGISITYSDQLTQGDPVSGTGAGAAPSSMSCSPTRTGLSWRTSTSTPSRYSVYELGREVKASEVPQIKSRAQGRRRPDDQQPAHR